MNAPFEDLTSADHLPSIALGIKILYHQGYDQHYLRNQGQEEAFWYEVTKIGRRVSRLSEKEEAALEEQFQNALHT